MIKIREAQVTDLDDILQLYSLLYGKNVLQKDADVQRIWNRIITDQFYHVIVAEEDGKLVSTCVCVIIQNIPFDHKPYAIVDNIVTHGEYRAQGLATACLQEAQRIAEENECYKIMLTTQSKLDSTHRFYEKLGYSKEDSTAFTKWLF
ncbi:MAG: GNAT family N-acetyltransferase [Ruminiclostridium sp.]|nr:GNAT family N-acetyltransferase [Ruminiclostridium sp.]